MHRRAEYGDSAYWKCKEEEVFGVRAKGAEDQHEIARLRQLVDRQRKTDDPAMLLGWLRFGEDPAKSLESLRSDVANDQVYVFNPRGEVIALPQGSMPIDFAYTIHIDVGHRTVGPGSTVGSCR